jgi:diguanylate cyclase (GGDEF)-like protein/hemerythrin-like metal-binding protein
MVIMENQAYALSHVFMAFSLAISAILIALGRKSRPFAVYSASFSLLAVAYLFYFTRLGRESLFFFANLSIFASQCVFVWGVREFDGRSRAWPLRFWAYLASFAVLQHLAGNRLGDQFASGAVTSLFAAVVAFEFLIVIKTGVHWLSKGARVKVCSVFAVIAAYHLTRCALNAINFLSGNELFGAEWLLGTSIVLSMAFSTLRMAVIVILDTARLMHEMEEKNLALENLALKDTLTGLFNRRTLETAFTAECQRQDRYRSPFSLVMIDIDHFKRVNDVFGHDEGDRVLVEVARRVRGNLRETDLLFRWGGEELLILVPGTGIAGATSLAEKVRRDLFMEPMPTVGVITASFGVVERNEGESREACFKRVDQAMYAAKMRGRNRVEAWSVETLSLGVSMRVDWRPEWESGVRLIDEEHRNLIELGNGLLNLSLAREGSDAILPVLDRLIADIQTHFSDEEGILAKVGYPDLAEHQEIHARLLNDARTTRIAFAVNAEDSSSLFRLIVERILIDHLLTVDAKFFPYVAPLREDQGAR